MKKKLLSLFLVATLVFTLTPAAFAAEAGEISGEEAVVEESGEENADAWDGTTTEAIPSNGQITTGAQLAYLSEQVNSGTSYSGVTLTLMNDIDLGNHAFTPIGSSDNPFKGTFNGNSYTIKNATITGFTSDSGARADSVLRAGIFGTVSGTVKNFKLDNIRVTSTATDIGSGWNNDKNEASTGVAVGTLESGTAEAVIVLSTCTISGIIRVGGVVGDCRSSSTISRCENYAQVTGGSHYSGGIVGAAHSGADASITYCTNGGGVSGANEVGGIIGYADRSNISNCENRGDVTGTGNYGTGGILGCDIYNYLLILRPANGSTITNCKNYGAVSAPRAGGILGAYVVAPSKDQKSSVIYSTISGCTNTGTITGTKVGAIYGAPISYKSGDGASVVGNMKAGIISCFVGGTVNSTQLTAVNFATYISADSTFIRESGSTFYEEVKSNE